MITAEAVLDMLTEVDLNTERGVRSLRLIELRPHSVPWSSIAGFSAAGWLKHPSPFLYDVAPLSLLDCDAGAQAVSEELGRIEYGEFA